MQLVRTYSVDLAEVELVNLEVVRFLGTFELHRALDC